MADSGVFAALAEFERSLIRERTKAGLTAARARGRLGGRRPKLNATQIQEVLCMVGARDIPITRIAELYGVSRTTIYKIISREQQTASA